MAKTVAVAKAGKQARGEERKPAVGAYPLLALPAKWIVCSTIS